MFFRCFLPPFSTQNLDMASKFNLIATWNPQCAASIPYPLFKLKDILATCADVFASKGKCCRCRPVVPTTQHPARRLLRRVGRVLSLVCTLMPPSDQFHISNSAQFSSRIRSSEAQAQLHYPHSNYRILMGPVDRRYL